MQWIALSSPSCKYFWGKQFVVLNKQSFQSQLSKPPAAMQWAPVCRVLPATLRVCEKRVAKGSTNQNAGKPYLKESKVLHTMKHFVWVQLNIKKEKLKGKSLLHGFRLLFVQEFRSTLVYSLPGQQNAQLPTRSLIFNQKKLISIVAKVWKQLNNQTQVVRETKFTEFQLIPTQCFHVIYNCGVVHQKNVVFLFCSLVYHVLV